MGSNCLTEYQRSGNRNEDYLSYYLWHHFLEAERKEAWVPLSQQSQGRSSRIDWAPQHEGLSPSWQDAFCIEMKCVWETREMKETATCCWQQGVPQNVFCALGMRYHHPDTLNCQFQNKEQNVQVYVVSLVAGNHQRTRRRVGPVGKKHEFSRPPVQLSHLPAPASSPSPFSAFSSCTLVTTQHLQTHFQLCFLSWIPAMEGIQGLGLDFIHCCISKHLEPRQAK